MYSIVKVVPVHIIITTHFFRSDNNQTKTTKKSHASGNICSVQKSLGAISMCNTIKIVYNTSTRSCIDDIYAMYNFELFIFECIVLKRKKYQQINIILFIYMYIVSFAARTCQEYINITKPNIYTYMRCLYKY